MRVTFTPLPSSTAGKSSLRSPGSTSLTFVNAHLAAFDEMVDKRNSDFQELSRKLYFDGIETLPVFPAAGEAGGNEDETNAQTSATLGELPPTMTVYETDVLFWMVSFV